MECIFEGLLDDIVVLPLELLDVTMESLLDDLLDVTGASLLELLVTVPKKLLEVAETAEEVLKSLLEVPLADTLSERVLLLTELVASLLEDVAWLLPGSKLDVLVVEDVAGSDIELDLLGVGKD